jgi:exonuclease VII large subunit
MGSVYTVSQVTSYIKNMFTQDFALNRVSIKGEVSNCKYHTSGHIYFTLKDDSAAVRRRTDCRRHVCRTEKGPGFHPGRRPGSDRIRHCGCI